MTPASILEHEKTDTSRTPSTLFMPNGSLVSSSHQGFVHAAAREVLRQWGWAGC